MMSAVIFGAGNIGRGFIGELFSESGFLVTFIDVDQPLVEALRKRGHYTLETVFNDAVNRVDIGPVTAIDGRDGVAVAEAVAGADIAATAVGARALPVIAGGLARGLALRAERGADPLNIIVCENLKGAAAALRSDVCERMPEELRTFVQDRTGFVDTVIGRMVPRPTDEMRRRDIALIRTEPYKELPVDRSGFRGPVPEIVAMVPYDRFAVFTARKLYIHNCGHAVLAYLGYLRRHEYGYEALRDEQIAAILRAALAESRDGIVHEYGADPGWLDEHVSDLMHRFSNRALGDTVFRLGCDPIRKLQPADRLISPCRAALAAGLLPVNLAAGVAAALCFDAADDPMAVQLQQRIAAEGVERVLLDLCGLEPTGALGTVILQLYSHMAGAADPLAGLADRIRELTGPR